VLKASRHGLFYGCETWHDTRCPGTHGAHPDGRPLGVPADQRTKSARRRAHGWFDRLWKKEHGALMKRGHAYGWLATALGYDAPHIGEMSAEECERVIELARAKLDELHHPPPPF